VSDEYLWEGRGKKDPEIAALEDLLSPYGLGVDPLLD
jgi:hypothetical protein